MAYKNYIPRPDSAFNLWQNNFVTKANVYIVGWALSATALTEWQLLTNTPGKKKLEWDEAWRKVATGQFESHHTVRKTYARKSYESGRRTQAHDTSLRLFIARYVRNNPQVTTEQKANLGLTIPDMIKTPHPGVDAASKSIGLLGAVKDIKHLMHRSSVTTPGAESRGLAYGVDGIEVHMAFTEATCKQSPPVSEFKFDGEVKYGLYARQFDVEQECLRAWYVARKRFKGKKKTYGPFSTPWSALIT